MKHFFGVPVILIVFGLIVSALSTALAVLFNLYIFTRVIPARVVTQTRIIERVSQSTSAASVKPSASPSEIPSFKYRIASPSAGGR
jgi:hypothetical protein